MVMKKKQKNNNIYSMFSYSLSSERNSEMKNVQKQIKKKFIDKFSDSLLSERNYKMNFYKIIGKKL